MSKKLLAIAVARSFYYCLTELIKTILNNKKNIMRGSDSNCLNMKSYLVIRRKIILN